MLERIFSMDSLWYLLLALYIPACLGLIVIVLLQKGKGTGFAGSFGMGAGPGSETVFGPRAGQTLPVKMTYVAAVIFVLISLGMSLIAGRVGKGDAPELIEGATMSSGVATELDALGLGKGVQGAAATSTPTASPPASTESTPEAATTAGESPAPAGEAPSPAEEPAAPQTETAAPANP
jgi:preprotein translocase subunit SecG